MTKDLEQTCPICNGTLRPGFISTHHGGQIMVNNAGFKWFDGELRKRGLFDAHIPVGEPGLMSSTVFGIRCENCRKIILNY